MSPTITFIGIAVCAAVLIVANVPWASLLARFKGTGGTSKPDRDAAVKAYDVLKAYSADRPTLVDKLKPIWGELE